jgi:hypothetical protein
MPVLFVVRLVLRMNPVWLLIGYLSQKITGERLKKKRGGYKI